jgi:F-type H+-transporting ATPase subunit epsilon
VTDPRTLQVSVVTPEGAAYEGAAQSVVAPAFDGEVAFHPMHAPFVGVLGHGELRVTPVEGEVEYFYLAGGVVQVADDVVAILAETVIPVAELDAADAQRRLDEALASEARGRVEIDARMERQEDSRARLRTAERAHARGTLTAEQVLQQPVE